jgi:CBS domain-containing protein
MAATTEESGPAMKKMRTESSVSPLTGPFATSDRFIRLVIGTKVDNVRPPENKIFVAQRTDLLIEVWKGLVQHKFLSVPVLQKTKSKYFGFLDMYDIVKFVVEFFGEKVEALKNSEDWFQLASQSEEFCKVTVNDVIKHPVRFRNPFFPVNSGYSLFAALEAMARERGLHRVPVIDENRKLITIVTQSQMVEILAKNLDIIGDKKNKTVNLTENYFEEVISVLDDSIAMDAFKLMVERNVSGLAVVDKEGKLVGNISLRDLKAMSTDARLFWRLFQTVHNFLLKIRHEDSGDRPRTIVTVKPTDTLETVIKKLAENRIHRVFIVDESKKPQGVISLKDILKEIITN